MLTSSGIELHHQGASQVLPLVGTADRQQSPTPTDSSGIGSRRRSAATVLLGTAIASGLWRRRHGFRARARAPAVLRNQQLDRSVPELAKSPR